MVKILKAYLDIYGELLKRFETGVELFKLDVIQYLSFRFKFKRNSVSIILREMERDYSLVKSLSLQKIILRSHKEALHLLENGNKYFSSSKIWSK